MDFAGYIKVPTTGAYTFSLKSDDASAMYIGDRKAAEYSHVWSVVDKSYPIDLEAGFQPFRVEYCQAKEKYELTASWEGPGFKKTVIPPEAFCRVP